MSSTEVLYKDTVFDLNISSNPFENISEMLITKQAAKANQNYEENKKLTPSPLGAIKFAIDKTAGILRMMPLAKHWVGPPDETSAQINKLIAQQKASSSYKEWLDTSNKLDKLMLNYKWKEKKETNLYDYKLLEERYNELRNARLKGDYKELLYIIRTKWCRNMANMDNINLYRHSYVGTKDLIEDYLKECTEVLNIFAKGGLDLDETHVLGMLTQTRKNIGRTALVLSGGGCFGLFHIGVLATLLELELFPKIISGSSAGGIMASIICVQTNEELLKLMSTITDRTFEIFGHSGDDKDGVLKCLSRLLKYGTWFDNKSLQATMKDFLGDLTFKESYNRTGRILNITVSPASVHEQQTLLNYLTAPNVLIWSAVCASCSLPGVFASSTIYEKNPRDGSIGEWSNPMVKFVDGSVHGDLPRTRLSEMFNVDHIIACQVNPHVVPFLKVSLQCVGGEIEHEFSAKIKQACNQAYGFLSTEAMHYLEVLSEVGIATNLCTKLRSVIAQGYSGDITILPDFRLSDFDKLLADPQPDFLLDATVRGARATWPKISIIKNHCRLEFLLDRTIRKIKTRLLTLKVKSLFNLQLPLVSPANFNFDDEEEYNYSLQSSSSIPIPNKLVHQRHRSETLSIGELEHELHNGAYSPKKQPKYSNRFLHANQQQSYHNNISRKASLFELRNQSLNSSQPPTPKSNRPQLAAAHQQKSQWTFISNNKKRPKSHNSSMVSIRAMHSPAAGIVGRRKSLDRVRKQRSATYTSGGGGYDIMNGMHSDGVSPSNSFVVKRHIIGSNDTASSGKRLSLGSDTALVSLDYFNGRNKHDHIRDHSIEKEEDLDGQYDTDTINNTISNATTSYFDDMKDTERHGSSSDYETEDDDDQLESTGLDMGFSYYPTDFDPPTLPTDTTIENQDNHIITGGSDIINGIDLGDTEAGDQRFEKFQSGDDEVSHTEEAPIDDTQKRASIQEDSEIVKREPKSSLRKSISFDRSVK